MSNYRLYLLPTDKDNAVIGKVEQTFQIKDFDGDVIIYEEGKLYNLQDMKRQIMASDTFLGIKIMLIEDHIQPMHLYLTDNNRILKGMWCVEAERANKLYKAQMHEGSYLMTGDSRVICTTDTALREDVIINFANDKSIEQNVPNFHHMFVATYMDMYNKGAYLIENIEPKTELVGERQRPKFVVEDNIMTVLIKVFKPVAKTYTSAELDKHLLAVMNLGMGLRQSQLNGSDLRSGNEVLEEYKTNNL
jgi:hypothetical protein